MSRRTASLWLPLAASVAVSTVFIARSAFHVQGGTAFSLFDDAMISMRFARNLAAGHGLRWNVPGPPVEGYSNLLWTLWMAIPHSLGISDLKTSLFVMVSAAGLLAANVFFVHEVARRISGGDSLATALAAWLTALSYPLVYWSLRGMEVGVVATAITAAVLLALRLRERVTRRDLVLFGAVLAGGVLTRDDSLLPLTVIAIGAVWMAPIASRRAIGVTAVSVLVGTVLAHEAFRVAYYGNALPNTYYLKLAGIPLGTRLKRGLEVDGHAFVTTLVAPLVFAVFGVVRRARYVSRAVVLLAAVVGTAVAYSTYTGGDAWEGPTFVNRYFASALPLLFVLTALGVVALLRELPGTRAVWAGAGTAVIILFAIVGETDILPNALLPGRPPALQLGLAAVCAVLVVVAVSAPSTRVFLGAALVGLGVVLAANGTAWRSWVDHNADGIQYDKAMTRYGIGLASATLPKASIAVTWAGAIPYFSHRPAVDELGKSDSTIAHEAPQPILFRPGHDKWDDAYSIGRLRPDVVAQLTPTLYDACRLREWGYLAVAPTVYVENRTPRVATARLMQVVRDLGLDRSPITASPPPPACRA